VNGVAVGAGTAVVGNDGVAVAETVGTVDGTEGRVVVAPLVDDVEDSPAVLDTS